ncbi:hypothetical protein GS582_12885 [Rhodococcus hoagii]|nr:hypothetical protein [Prescottella equi]
MVCDELRGCGIDYGLRFRIDVHGGGGPVGHAEGQGLLLFERGRELAVLLRLADLVGEGGTTPERFADQDR